MPDKYLHTHSTELLLNITVISKNIFLAINFLDQLW